MRNSNRPRDVVVIGGGLSGLAAAYELEQHDISYTLIEVKPRLGGSIISVRRDGFVMDGGPFAFDRPTDWPTLHALELDDDLIDVPTRGDQSRVAFRGGTQMLTDALADRLTGKIIPRMAVTGVNRAEDGHYRICLENGLALTARGVIVAAAARYAGRMFRTLAPALSDALENYHYDHVTRVALGYTANNKPANPPVSPPDMIFAALNHTDADDRTPPGGLLVQSAVRVPLDRTDEAALVASVVETLGWRAPDVAYVNYWREADPLTVTGPAPFLQNLPDALPDEIALIGNCYRPLDVPGRTAAGREAARRVLAAL